MKTKPHHPIEGREKGGDLEVVQERTGGGTFNCYALLMAKTMSTTSQAKLEDVPSRCSTLLVSQAKLNRFSCEAKSNRIDC